MREERKAEWAVERTLGVCHACPQCFFADRRLTFPYLTSPRHTSTHTNTEYTVDWKLPSLQSPPRDAFDPLTVAVGDTVVFEWKGGLAYMLYRVSKREWLESVFVRERGGRCMQRLVLTSILPCSPHHSRVPRVRGRL